ncbi:hypothetical protein Swit_2582 [Rhizorhabdus wittichii RW1]|uniref:Uncharacterized protein n=1 Tax=Rhizorhabdus wittichii (strain DSM 6014 / CCUG 31198 / JCM 15750 / NBRC 105917 / EY 4224 / RW1) TaxID=392499 RepID=A0A9J9HC91_RHIWR|nr:hypothetical protein Swit_2582 [Rhizorhabdus wittichii RW1]
MGRIWALKLGLDLHAAGGRQERHRRRALGGDDQAQLALLGQPADDERTPPLAGRREVDHRHAGRLPDVERHRRHRDRRAAERAAVARLARYPAVGALLAAADRDAREIDLHRQVAGEARPCDRGDQAEAGAALRILDQHVAGAQQRAGGERGLRSAHGDVGGEADAGQAGERRPAPFGATAAIDRGGAMPYRAGRARQRRDDPRRDRRQQGRQIDAQADAADGERAAVEAATDGSVI